MAKSLIVLNVVGLSPYMLGENTPHLNKLLTKGYQASPLKEVFPAVTTTAQSAMLTGKLAQDHGIVGNGWYFKALAEVGFWKQANQLVSGEKIWDVLKAKQPNFKVSQLFWWYNMYANVDHSMTPRPHYLADGAKIFDLYSSPKGLHQSIEKEHGTFPFFNFWGPKAGIGATDWIAKASVSEYKLNKPDLQFVYLPHLDYNLQRLGASDKKIAQDINAVDNAIGEILTGLVDEQVEYLVVSEYGITDVDTPVHINRILREKGYIEVRETQVGNTIQENLDCGASTAFAVSDHQCAHVYVNDLTQLESIKTLLENTPGIERVLDKKAQQTIGVCHERSGDLFVIANTNAWFTYYFWLDDNKAPDYARTIDIHRKPGYDPLEMFVDPAIRFPLLKMVGKVAKKKLGFRMLMDVIPLNANLIKGSHGRPNNDPQHGAIIMLPPCLQNKIAVDQQGCYQMTDVYHHIYQFFQPKS